MPTPTFPTAQPGRTLKWDTTGAELVNSAYDPDLVAITTADLAKGAAGSAKQAADAAYDATLKAGSVAAYADQAQSAANAAALSSQSAASSRDQAVTSASQAESAKVVAEAARDAAVTAKDLAVAADASAEAARSAAVSAKDQAVAAATASEAARDGSVNAKTVAESARDYAVSAKTAAETAQSGAVSAKDQAVAAQSAAEAARDASVSAKTQSETIRDQLLATTGTLGVITLAETNLALSVLLQQKATGSSVARLVNAVSDRLIDQAGIGSLGGATWSSGYVSNPAISGLSADLITGSETYSASAQQFGAAANAADESTSTLWAADYNYVSQDHWWEVEFTSGKRLSKVTVRNRSGYASGFAESEANSLISTTLQYWDGVTWQTLAVRPNGWTDSVDVDWTFAPPALGYTRWRLYFLYKYHGGVGGQTGIETIRMYEPVDTSPPAIATVSTTATAASAPSTVTLVAIHKDVSGTAVLNTDLILKVSRDNGTTWTTVTMTDLGLGPVSGSHVLQGMADVSGQPSGTSIKWKVETANGKEQQVHGIWMQWR